MHMFEKRIIWDTIAGLKGEGGTFIANKREADAAAGEAMASKKCKMVQSHLHGKITILQKGTSGWISGNLMLHRCEQKLSLIEDEIIGAASF